MPKYSKNWKSVWKKLTFSQKFSLFLLSILLVVIPLGIILIISPLSIYFPRACGSPVTSPVTPPIPPYQNRIWWVTKDVYLSSDHFYIQANGLTYLDNIWPLVIASDQNSPDINNFDVLWHENGSEMRVNMLFKQDGTKWWLDELKFYNGRVPAAWYKLNPRFIGASLGVPFRNSIQLTAVPENPALGTIHFTNLELLPFRQIVAPPLTPEPTPCFVRGDANRDCRVDGLDYAVWYINFGKRDPLGPRDGDFDDNGKVDGLDYAIWYIAFASF